MKEKEAIKDTEILVIANLSLKRPINIDDIKYAIDEGFKAGVKFTQTTETGGKRKMNKEEFKKKLGELFRETSGMKDEEVKDAVNEVFGWDNAEITALTSKEKRGGK